MDSPEIIIHKMEGVRVILTETAQWRLGKKTGAIRLTKEGLGGRLRVLPRGGGRGEGLPLDLKPEKR